MESSDLSIPNIYFSQFFPVHLSLSIREIRKHANEEKIL